MSSIVGAFPCLWGWLRGKCAADIMLATKRLVDRKFYRSTFDDSWARNLKKNELAK
jgi:hypothetical protein